MAALNSGELLEKARRIVIKVGSSLLVDPASGELRADWLRGLAEDVAERALSGRGVVLVSSGSIALGRSVLALDRGQLSLEQSQAAAAVGQIRLAQAYQEVLAPHGIKTGQVLVTLEDSENRRRYLNSRATLASLREMGVVPVVNENDTVATDEIRFGDNDRLAAQVASLVGANVLVLLSDIDGLYTADPRRDTKAAHVALVEKLTPRIEAMAGGVGSHSASGGMITKLLAARTAMAAGCTMAITAGDVPRPLRALADGAKATWFRGAGDPQVARKQWISGMRPRGRLFVDEGAARALRSGRSLLPAGVRAVDGQFGRGDPVEIRTENGELVAKALAGYGAADARAIMGCQSSEIADKLGYRGRSAIVHRDDMAV
ncbi:MAG: glutamate 5-kinase [Paracoccaceae bacterium]